MYQLALIIHILVSATLIGLVLLQQGKGAEAGAAFGGGASGTMFGSRGSGNFLTRTTAVIATIFFATCISLGYIASHQVKQMQSMSVVPISDAAPAKSEMKPGDVPNINVDEQTNKNQPAGEVPPVE